MHLAKSASTAANLLCIQNRAPLSIGLCPTNKSSKKKRKETRPSGAKVSAVHRGELLRVHFRAIIYYVKLKESTQEKKIYICLMHFFGGMTLTAAGRGKSNITLARGVYRQGHTHKSEATQTLTEGCRANICSIHTLFHSKRPFYDLDELSCQTAKLINSTVRSSCKSTAQLWDIQMI